ncbi:MAG: amidohydrolase family protein [Gammaproteobacteria bacterium]
MSATRFTAVCLAAALVASAAVAQDLLIRGARVHTAGSAGTLENADVLVRGGNIADIGSGLSAPEGAAIVDANGRALTPGVFGGLTRIGVEDVELEAATVDAELAFLQDAWKHQWRPEFDVTRAFNARSPVVAVARVEGVTWAMVAPSGDASVISGQGAAATLDGRFDAILPGSRSLFVNWGSAGHEGSGGSRAAQYMLFDQAIREVKDPASAGEGALLFPEGRAALKGFLASGRVVFRVHRASDIRAVIDYARKNGMKPVISGGNEAWLVAKELAAADVPVILNSLDNLPADFDRLGARLDNAKLLQEAGVKVAFSIEDGRMARKNRQLAGNAAAHGLSWEAALAGVTSAPARIFGLADRGTIEKGKAADLVLWSGDPLEVTTVAERVWIGGQPVEMKSRQTELRDRYLERLRSTRANP